MKVCFFTKYPPTEGGTASRSYWLVRALGERGIDVHIITNALEEELWREKINFEDPEDLANYQPPNVYVHSLDANRMEFRIGKNRLINLCYESRLASLGIETIERYRCDVIDSHYLLPFGVAAYLAGKISGRPLILRHAASDINTIISKRTFHPLYKKIFGAANLIFTSRQRESFLSELGIAYEKLFFDFGYSVNFKYFNPQVAPTDLSRYGIETEPNIPVITYIGKISRHKGVYELVEAVSHVKEDFLLLFIAGGPGLNSFKEFLKKFPHLKEKYHFLGFVPPWKIPGILKRSTCLVQLETDFPIAFHMPIQPLEAMAVGTCPVISEEVYETYKNLPGLEREKNILVADPKNISKFKNLMEKIIKNQNSIKSIGQEGNKVFNQSGFENSVSAMIKIYDTLVKENKSFKSCLEELRNTIIKYL